jgi:glycine dehydrogenase subunit 1
MERITALDGFEAAFEAPFFTEFAVRCPRPAKAVNEHLLGAGITGGYELGRDYPGMDDFMLFCVTETTTDEDVDRLIEALKKL